MLSHGTGSKPTATTTKIIMTTRIKKSVTQPLTRDDAELLVGEIRQLKIRELRTRAEKQLGAKFDLPAFHDQILMEGALPLAVLDAHVQAWIDQGGPK